MSIKFIYTVGLVLCGPLLSSHSYSPEYWSSTFQLQALFDQRSRIDNTMSSKPSIAVNINRKRHRGGNSANSDSSDCSPVRNFPDPVYLSEKIPPQGGFSSLVTTQGGDIVRELYGFPTKVLSASERETVVKQFVAKLYHIQEGSHYEVEKILLRLAPSKECKRRHVIEPKSANTINNNVANMPAEDFRVPLGQLANSTPGPRLPPVTDVLTTRSPIDSLRIINHLQLSDADCRYIRGISLVSLATEYSVKKVKCEVMGNGGKGWVESEKLSFKQWFRDEEQEVKHFKNGHPARKEVVVGKIRKENIVAAVQHFADSITDYVDMQSYDNCPEILHDTAVCIMGNDAGQGFTREGIRFVNRANANDGSKVFVTTVMVGTDKSLSLFQKQAVFSSLSVFRNLSSVRIGGRHRRLVRISAMDYEAAAEEVGTQVCVPLFKV